MALNIWVGSGSVTSQFGNLQSGAHIDNYNLYAYNNTSGAISTDLTGPDEGLSSATTTVSSATYFNETKASSTAKARGVREYKLTGHIMWAEAYNGAVVSNEATASQLLEVRVPLNSTSAPASMTIMDEAQVQVWSNSTVLNDFTFYGTCKYAPYSFSRSIVTTATDKTAAIGYAYATSISDSDMSSMINWVASSSKNYDLGAASKTIDVSVKNNINSADPADQINGDVIYTLSKAILVKNAVTALSTSNITLYKSSTKNNSKTVAITPAIPFSYTLSLVSVSGGSLSGNVITASNDAGVTVTLNQASADNKWTPSLTFNISNPKAKTTTTTITFKVRSTQSASAVDTATITFTATGVTAITNANFYEQTVSSAYNVGIGTVSSVDTTGASVSETHSGANVTLTGANISVDTKYTVTAYNADGAWNTISGTIYAMQVRTFNINSGDYAAVTKVDQFAKITSLTSSSSTVIAGWVIKSDGSSVNIFAKPISDSGSATITITGTNASGGVITEDITINVKPVTLTLSQTDSASSTIGQ